MLDKKQSIKLFTVICCFTVICIVIYLYKGPNGQLNKNDGKKLTVDKKEKINHLIIYSTIFYNISKIYAPNSMIILLNANKYTQQNEAKFYCFSKNSTTTLISSPLLRLGHQIKSADCLWEFFIANCTTVSNPKYFGISEADSKTPKNNSIQIEFEYPEVEKYPVVLCYPPMVYESRWQQIIFATEIYHYFGTDLQIQYINSAMKEIVDILELYEAKKWIKIKKFAFFDFDNETISLIGVNPMLEIKSRNQPLTLTDCLMKYRESSEFIIAADVDDVLFLKQGETFFEEFSFWKKIYPNAAALMYYRIYAKLDVAKTFNNFSLQSGIESLKSADSIFVGKSVYQTGKAETAWIHWPGMDNSTTISIPPEKGKMLHVQIKDSEIRTVKSVYQGGEKENPNNLKPFIPNIPKNDLLKMNINFAETFGNITNFEANSIYSDHIFQCYKKHEILNVPCKTMLECKKPSIVPNFNCKIARRSFTTNILSQNVRFYVPLRDSFWTTSSNGCNILLGK